MNRMAVEDDTASAATAPDSVHGGVSRSTRPTRPCGLVSQGLYGSALDPARKCVGF